MLKLGIIGYPLKHSISAPMQTAAMKEIGVEGSYEKFETEQTKLAAQIEFFKTNDFSGFNVTIPYKVDILDFLDEIDDNAKLINAVNTVKITPDKCLIGYNTDIYGFVEAIPPSLRQNLKSAAVIGAGGASRAVITGLVQTGVKSIRLFVRNPNNIRELAGELQNKFADVNFETADLNKALNLKNTDIIVNATPLGTIGENENQSPLDKAALAAAPKTALVYDLVYNPQDTLFIQNAQSLGLQTIGGLDMLVLQGLRAFEIWSGKTPSFDVMKQAALNALKEF
ncbi:MAG: shikimate dehydrogenase [Candidatus Gastranaerophilales bacterium]|nr:shikimate dehydrogenase [Candidatus Gastranaerophilales bacterium]